MSARTDMKLTEYLTSIKDADDERQERFDHSGELGDEDQERIDAIYADWRKRWAAEVAAAKKALGPPDLDSRKDRDWLDELYPEALEGAGWEVPGGLLYVALEHAEPDEPIAIVAGKVLAE